MVDCARCGFPRSSDELKPSITKPWELVCPICYRAEKIRLKRDKKKELETPLGTFFKNQTTLKAKTTNILREPFKFNLEKPEVKTPKEVVIKEVEYVEVPIERVPGTRFIMDRLKSYGGSHFLNEEIKNELSLADLRSYQGKKKEVTARWMVDSFSNPGDIVLDPFAGSGMLPFISKVLDRQPIAFDILPSAVSATKALLATPARKRIIRIADQIIRVGKEIEPTMDVYPRSIKKWYDLDAFKDAIRFYEVIDKEMIDGLQGPDGRMKNFHMQVALYILQRISYGRGGYSWKMAEPAYRKRAMWDRDQGDEYMRHIMKVTRNDFNQWDTNFRVEKANAFIRIPLENGSVDRIITDPPYADMIDYMAQVWVEEWFLGWKDIVTMDELLGVSATPKKGIEFAHQHMIQDLPTFFERMEKAMKEFYRVLRSDGTMVFIIGDFKEHKTVGGLTITKIINPFRTLEKIARNIGFVEVYCINKAYTRQSTYKHTHGEEVKYERVILFRKGLKQDDILIDRKIEEPKRGLDKWF